MMIPRNELVKLKTVTLIDLYKYYAKQHELAHELYNFTYDDSIFDEYYEEIGHLLDDLNDILLNDRREEWETIILGASTSERI